MKFVLLVALLLTPPLPMAQAEGDEAEFTVKVEHYEQPSRPGFRKADFQGRAWDLSNVLKRDRQPSGLELVQAERKHLGKNDGFTYCVRVRPTDQAKKRGEGVANLLQQLEQRSAEMRDAGAYYRVEYPSPCADRPARRLAEQTPGGGRG